MKIVSIIKKSIKDDIVRRVFIKNTFDGVITILGILLAFFIGFVLAVCLKFGANEDLRTESFYLKNILRNIINIDIKDSVEALLEAKRKARVGLK